MSQARCHKNQSDEDKAKKTLNGTLVDTHLKLQHVLSRMTTGHLAEVHILRACHVPYTFRS